MSNIVDATAVIAQLLRDKQVGTHPKDKKRWPIFTDVLDDGEDEAIAIFTQPLKTEGRIHRTGEIVRKYAIQTRVRSGANPVAKKKYLEIEATFDEVNWDIVTVEDKKYRVEGIHENTTVGQMGPDKNNRPNYSLNHTATIERIN